MPYERDEDLPDRLKSNLPEHAQHIYRKAFNSAWKQYADPEKRDNPDEDREAVAHQVAWNAVKQDYHKEDDKWVRNDN